VFIMPCDVLAKLRLVTGQKGQIGFVVWNHPRGDTREMLEHFADVQGARQSWQQIVKRLEALRRGFKTRRHGDVPHCRILACGPPPAVEG
jgi:hypothetical protein